jgi:hypothetical protein
MDLHLVHDIWHADLTLYVSENFHMLRSLPEDPCGDMCVHCWCSPCAVCQEVRPYGMHVAVLHCGCSHAMECRGLVCRKRVVTTYHRPGVAAMITNMQL